MRERLLRHIGLAKPYRFERTLIALVAAILVIAIAIPVLQLMARSHLAMGTPRGWYVIYLAILVVAALLLAPFPRTAGVLLALAAIEAGLGLGSLVLYKYELIPSTGLVPMNGRVFRFDWHPLLQAVPAPTTEAEARQMAPVNSDGVRGREYSAAGLRGKIVVALFGGSTTFDALPEGQSWPEQLQQILRPRYAIINRGMGGYTTAEHVIQTAFYERYKGAAPNCSIYFVGANDLRNAHMPGLDPGYANFHMPAQADVFRTRPGDLTGWSFSPLSILVGRLMVLAFDTIRVSYSDGKPSTQPDPVLEEIFARNVATISAINRQRGIRTVWVPQLMNSAVLTEETPSYWIPLVPRKAVFALLGRLDDILKRQAAAQGDVHVALPVEKFEKEGFVDDVHFTKEGSLTFATLMAPVVADNCR